MTGSLGPVSRENDTRVAELEAALLETEQRLARVGELELQLRELSIDRERLARQLDRRSPLTLLGKAIGRLRSRGR